MSALAMRTRIMWPIVGVVLLVSGVSAALVLSSLNGQVEVQSVKITLIRNAGVMIETEDIRIYIDPINLPSNYSSLPGDVVLVTHEHADHYQGDMISMLQKDDTVNVFPANMSDQIDAFDGIGVVPGDSLQVGPVNITAFYMYTWAPEGYEASHPIERNWTSYIIDINGITIFHAGDSKNIPEYSQLKGLIDVAMLPLGPGCQTMAGYEVVQAIQVIEPTFFIPIHFEEGADVTFMSSYGEQIADADCEVIWLDYLSSYTFEP
jgi:L-ascorbate metabolism protein UlaG (beta-lactamase superfamily)